MHADRDRHRRRHCRSRPRPRRRRSDRRRRRLSQGGNERRSTCRSSGPGVGWRPRCAGALRGPFVTWMVWRGPAERDFEPRNVRSKDGKAPNGRVSSPGEYVLRARASDRVLFVDKDVKVTVTGGATPQPVAALAHTRFSSFSSRRRRPWALPGPPSANNSPPNTSPLAVPCSSTRTASSPPAPARPAIPANTTPGTPRITGP